MPVGTVISVDQNSCRSMQRMISRATIGTQRLLGCASLHLDRPANRPSSPLVLATSCATEPQRLARRPCACRAHAPASADVDYEALRNAATGSGPRDLDRFTGAGSALEARATLLLCDQLLVGSQNVPSLPWSRKRGARRKGAEAPGREWHPFALTASAPTTRRPRPPARSRRQDAPRGTPPRARKSRACERTGGCIGREGARSTPLRPFGEGGRCWRARTCCSAVRIRGPRRCIARM